jgi:xanthine dehydrogenase accessory factor
MATVLESDLFVRAAQLKAAGTPFVLATVVRAVAPTSAHPGDKAILTRDGGVHGWVGGSCAEPIVRDEAEGALADGRPRLVRITPDTDQVLEKVGLSVHRMTCFSGGELDIYLEPHLPAPALLVFGTSPVGRALAELGRAMKFQVTVVDLGTAAPEGAVRRLAEVPPVDAASTAVVVASHGVFDEEALEHAVGLRPAYLALVASRRRREQVLGALAARGLDRAVLARVHAPAGLDLGARTPEEVALTILAELVAERRGKVVSRLVDAAAAPELPALPVVPEVTATPVKACCHAKQAAASEGQRQPA